MRFITQTGYCNSLMFDDSLISKLSAVKQVKPVEEDMDGEDCGCPAPQLPADIEDS